MFALFEIRTIVAVGITLVAGNFALGREFPFATNAVVPFVVEGTLFIGYLYLARTMFRLPFVVVIAGRRARLARARYGLNWRESLRDGVARVFLDRRRWTVGMLALVDRAALLGFTLYATTPYLGVFLVRLVGLIGLVVLLIVYLMSGRFAFLLDDNAKIERRVSLPFLDTGDG